MPSSQKKFCFVGFNINLDAKIYIKTAEQYAQLCEIIKRVEGTDLLNIWQGAFEECSAREELVSSKLVDTMLQNFEHEFVLGGQEGFFFQNIVHSFSDDYTPVLHLPCRAKQLIDFIHGVMPEALVFETTKSGKPTLVPLSKITPSNEPAPIHIVLEYPLGLEVNRYAEEEKLRSFKANRFIFTYDEVNAELKIDPHLDKGLQLMDENWVALISGYHLLDKKKLTDAFKKQHTDILQTLSEKCHHVHFELAYTHDHDVKNFLLEGILPHITSCGLNEVELDLFAKDMGLFDPSDSLPTRLKKFAHSQPVPTFLFHCAGCYIALSKTNALNESTCFNAFKTAEENIIRLRSLPDSKRYQIPLDFKEELRADAQMHAHYPDLIKPITSTVGLGDTISSSILLDILR